VLSTSFALLLIVGPLLLAPPAAALTVDVASIRLDRRASDAFHLAGRFGGVELAGATTIVLSLGGLTPEVPVAKFRRHGGVYTFRTRSGSALGSTLRLDTRHGRFSAAGQHLALAGLPNPLPVSVGTDQATDCAVVRLAARPAGGNRMRVVPGRGRSLRTRTRASASKARISSS
jgi:hypothetical protein